MLLNELLDLSSSSCAFLDTSVTHVLYSGAVFFFSVVAVLIDIAKMPDVSHNYLQKLLHWNDGQSRHVKAVTTETPILFV